MKSRNELANWFSAARKAGKISAGAVEFSTCSICACPLRDQEATRDAHGMHHEDLYCCIENLKEQQRALEFLLDSARRMENLLRPKRQPKKPTKQTVKEVP